MAELAALSPQDRAHPEALDMEWKACARLRDWESALAVAERLLETTPEEVAGWIHRSYCLHELQRTREAMELLDPAYPQFPNDFIVPYNLACYACQLGDLAAAKTWLGRALHRGHRKTVKGMALRDSDLAPLRAEIEDM